MTVSFIRLRRLRTLVAAGSSAALMACGGADKPTSSEPTQVAARVNSQDISVHQVDALLQSQPALISRYGDQAREKVLNSLIEQELAAQAAKRADLDHAPQVLQALELSRREVLARAYQDQLAAKAVEPSSDEVDRFYDSHPELFAQRKRFTLQDVVVDLAGAEPAPLRSRVAELTRPDDVEPAVRSAGARYTSRVHERFAEEIPAALLPKIAGLVLGHSVWIDREGGAEIFSLKAQDPAPLTLAEARPTIKAYLMQERRRSVVDAGMQSLRQAAKIDYVGVPPRASAPASTPAAVR